MSDLYRVNVGKGGYYDEYEELEVELEANSEAEAIIAAKAMVENATKVVSVVNVTKEREKEAQYIHNFMVEHQIEEANINYDNKLGVLSPYIKKDEKHIYFGRYPQGPNGEEMPIEWRILQKEGEKAFIMAEHILHVLNLNNLVTNVNYNDITSVIQIWLNNTFYNKAFNNYEKIMIQRTKANNSTKSTSNHYIFNIYDKLFLLSDKQATNPQYGFYNETRIMSYTPNVLTREVPQIERERTINNCAGAWLLLSPDSFPRLVNLKGDIKGSFYAENYFGIVPACWVNLDITDKELQDADSILKREEQELQERLKREEQELQERLKREEQEAAEKATERIKRERLEKQERIERERQEELKKKKIAKRERIETIFQFIAMISPVITSIVFAIILFTNKTQVSIQYSVFYWTIWCVGWVFYTLASLAASYFLISERFVGWDKWQVKDAKSRISSSIVAGIVIICSIIVFSQSSKLSKNFDPTTFVKFNATDKTISTTYSGYKSTIAFTLTNDTDINVSYISGEMDFYDDSTLIGTWDVEFVNNCNAQSTINVIVSFEEQYPQLYYVKYDSLGIQFGIKEMRFNGGDSTYKCNGEKETIKTSSP